MQSDSCDGITNKGMVLINKKENIIGGQAYWEKYIENTKIEAELKLGYEKLAEC